MPMLTAGAIEALELYLKSNKADQVARLQLVDLYASEMETAERRLVYYTQDLLSIETLPTEFRSAIAVRAARLYLDRDQTAMASGMIDQALALNPINPEACELNWEGVKDGGTTVEKVAALLGVLRANPAQPDVMTQLGSVLAAAGMHESAQRWYGRSFDITPRMGRPLSKEVMIDASASSFILGQTKTAETRVSSLLNFDPSVFDAHLIRIMAARRLGGTEVGTKATDSAVDSLSARINALHKELAGEESPTTKPSGELSERIPDPAADAALLKDKIGTPIADSYATAWSDLAFVTLMYGAKPADAAPAAPAASAASAASAAEKRVQEAASAASAALNAIEIKLPPGPIADAVHEAIEQARREIDAAIEEARQEAEEAAEESRAEAAAELPPTKRQRVRKIRLGDFLPNLAMLWIVASIMIKITYKGRIQAEVKAAQATETAESESLKRQVAEARMAALQAQVEPHFLFNTLASIDHLIETDPPRASTMQKNLITYLRATLHKMRESTTTLGREADLITAYLEILKVRMEERLSVKIDVPAGLRSAAFPPMMLQSLVENAIKHGLEPSSEPATLSVGAEIHDGTLRLMVADTGVGYDPDNRTTGGTGLGLANIRERLELLYGSAGRLEIAANRPRGTLATLTIPYTAMTRAPSQPATMAP